MRFSASSAGNLTGMGQNSRTFGGGEMKGEVGTGGVGGRSERI